MKLSNLAAIALVTSLAAGSVFAADVANTTTPPVAGAHGGPGFDKGKHFKETDTNGDGVISKDEWRAQGDKMFAERDTNHDGKISQQEMEAFHQARHAEWKANHPEGRGPQGSAPTTAPATHQ